MLMKRKKLLILLALLLTAVTGAWAQQPATTYTVKLADGTKDAKNWTIASGENSATGDAADGLTGLRENDAVTLTYGGRLKVKSVNAVLVPTEEPVTLATPLTMEAVTDGTIVVTFNNPTSEACKGMKYSVNGGQTKTEITSTTTIEGLKAGDKVQFYGIGTSNTSYGDNPAVNISGGTATVKVYGNIMSLLDETDYATNYTDLPNDEYVFYGLFWGNTTLIDASELLLPATTLADYCYQAMFEGCTNLTTAPKLPAETLAEMCYQGMFEGCTKLTNAYVKAEYTVVDGRCNNMFDGCTAAGAVLHTTPGYNKEIWETKMGSNKTWPNWTVADDWQD